MAESVTSPDQTVWTIKLKSGWTFHNGEPVTAQSYVDAWNAGAYGPNAYGNAYFFQNIKGYQDLQADKGKQPKAKAMSGLKVIDDTTLQVTLNSPFSQFPLTLGYTAFYPLPKAYAEDPKGFEEAPIGNGPFQMDGSWQHDRAVNVKRYENYAGDRAKADAIEFRVYSNINTAYNDLLAGNLDIMDNLPPERLADARQVFGDRYIERDSSASPTSASRCTTSGSTTPTCARRSRWRSTARRSSTPSSTAPTPRPTRWSPRWCEAPGRTPAGRPAPSTPSGPRSCLPRPAAGKGR